MQFFKRDANKAAEKKFRDSKNESHQTVAKGETATAPGTTANTPVVSVAENIAPEQVPPPETENASSQAPVDVSQQTVVAQSVNGSQPVTGAQPVNGAQPANGAPEETPAEDAPTMESTATETVEPDADATLASTEPGEPSVTDVTDTTVTAPLTSDLTHGPLRSVTSSVVIQTKSNTPGKDKEKEKMDAAATYMYGQKDEQHYIPEKKPSSSYSDSQPRTNRAQELRQSRNLKRINEEKMMREQMLKERIIKARSEMGESDSDLSDEEGEPIQARLIPKSLYHKPKIHVRETVSSKFRYLFNRKPPGVTVYFKQADDKDPKKKPPFVVAAVNHCF